MLQFAEIAVRLLGSITPEKSKECRDTADLFFRDVWLVEEKKKIWTKLVNLSDQPSLDDLAKAYVVFTKAATLKKRFNEEISEANRRLKSEEFFAAHGYSKEFAANEGLVYRELTIAQSKCDVYEREANAKIKRLKDDLAAKKTKLLEPFQLMLAKISERKARVDAAADEAAGKWFDLSESVRRDFNDSIDNFIVYHRNRVAKEFKRQLARNREYDAFLTSRIAEFNALGSLSSLEVAIAEIETISQRDGFRSSGPPPLEVDTGAKLKQLVPFLV